MQLGDARKLTQDAQEALRRRAVKLVTVNRKPVRDVAEVIGVARWTVYKWVSAFRERGEQAIAKKRRGQKHGERAALSLTQCKMIQRFITDRCPDQLKMPFALWTRGSFNLQFRFLRSLRLGPFCRACHYRGNSSVFRGKV